MSDLPPPPPSAPPPPPPGYVPYAQPASSNYAPWGARVAAYLLDGIIPGIPYYALALIGGAIGDVVGVLFLLVGIAWIIYFFVRNIIAQGSTGQSFGKMVMGTRLIKEQTGQPIGGGAVFGRLFVHILDAIPCYLGYLWPLWDAKRQTFADKVMGTIVTDGAPKTDIVAAFKKVAFPS